MLVRQVADPKLAQFAYLIGCPRTGEAIVIDPERDVDRYFEREPVIPYDMIHVTTPPMASPECIRGR